MANLRVGPFKSQYRWGRALNVLDLFSGIGGFSLGLERAGMRTVAFCEIEPYARAILRRHWPDVPCYDDVRTITADRLRADGIVPNVICGGFPCQDISPAGTGAGLDGERSGLWFEYLRIIGDFRPEVAILENSAALLHQGLERILSGLAQIGYGAEWHCLRASSVGAPFEGDRLYLLATPDKVDGQAGMGVRRHYLKSGAVQRAYHRNRQSVWLESTSRSARMGDGFSDYVDRRRRTEVIGNAVVPLIPQIIGEAIMRFHLR